MKVRTTTIWALVLAAAAAGSVSGCNCEGETLHSVPPPPEYPDAEPPPPPPPPPDDAGFAEDSGSACAASGVVTGRVCAPANRDWVAGALITLAVTDCHGDAQSLSAVSGSDGSFRVENVPAGQWTLTAQAGQFSRNYQVNVQDGQTTAVPDDQLCVMQDVHIAVITGNGDRIETLLTNLGINFDTYDGGSNYSTEAEPFLRDLTRLHQYDLIFIDCAAATTHSQVDLGSNDAQIVSNLRDYVMNGGSLYSSDWAVVFLALAFPNQIVPVLSGGGPMANPFSTEQLDGYAPQTVSANVVDMNLMNALRTSRVSITFPDQTGARSGHWGLLDRPGSSVRVLVEGDVDTCQQSAQYCDNRSSPGPRKTHVPLAIAFKLTPAEERGGNVFYTSFHNIAQQGNDVANILKYIVFHL